jgi:hypothetical protein
MKLNKKIKRLTKVASRLDDQLVNNVPNVVGVCVEPDKHNPSTMALYVMLNDPRYWNLIPQEFQGHRVFIKLMGAPKGPQA